MYIYIYIYIFNITSAWAVDREFVNIYLGPLASFGCLWVALVFPGVDFGVHLAPFGLPLGPLRGALALGLPSGIF